MAFKFPTLLRIVIYFAGIGFVIAGLFAILNYVQAVQVLTPAQKSGLLLAMGALLIFLSNKF